MSIQMKCDVCGAGGPSSTPDSDGEFTDLFNAAIKAGWHLWTPRPATNAAQDRCPACVKTTKEGS